MTLIETAGWVATGLALIGVWLNNRRVRACFAMWLVSNTMTFTIHAASGLWPLAARDAAFFALTIHGWQLWGDRVHRPAPSTAGDVP